MNENIGGNNEAKVIFLGDNGVGKSAILASIINGTTSLPENCTIFSGTFDKNDGSGEKVSITFWDTIKQENYKNHTPIYYKSALGAIVVFDITNRSSFEKLNEIIEKVKEEADPSIITFLVGNKKDLESNGNRVVTKEEAEKYAENIGAFYIEVSALSKEGINDLINLLTIRIPKPTQSNQVHRLYQQQPLKTNFCSRLTCGAR